MDKTTEKIIIWLNKQIEKEQINLAYLKSNYHAEDTVRFLKGIIAGYEFTKEYIIKILGA